MNDFLQRLKQHKLVQWAIAYIAFAFALIQVLDVISRAGTDRMPAASAAFTTKAATSTPQRPFLFRHSGAARALCGQNTGIQLLAFFRASGFLPSKNKSWIPGYVHDVAVDVTRNDEASWCVRVRSPMKPATAPE